MSGTLPQSKLIFKFNLEAVCRKTSPVTPTARGSPASNIGSAGTIDGMTLHRVVYSSRVARQIRFADAEEIARVAAELNQLRGLTGLLVYTPSHFLQVLEGDSDDVRATMARIRVDPRHDEVRVLDQRDVERREFADWAMTARQLRASEGVYLPTITADQALQVLRRVRDEA